MVLVEYFIIVMLSLSGLYMVYKIITKMIEIRKNNELINELNVSINDPTREVVEHTVSGFDPISPARVSKEDTEEKTSDANEADVDKTQILYIDNTSKYITDVKFFPSNHCLEIDIFHQLLKVSSEDVDFFKEHSISCNPEKSLLSNLLCLYPSSDKNVSDSIASQFHRVITSDDFEDDDDDDDDDDDFDDIDECESDFKGLSPPLSFI